MTSEDRTSKSPNIRAHLLQRGITLSQNNPEVRQDLLSVFSSIESFQKQIQDCRSKLEALRRLQVFLEGMDFFHATAFYVVNEDFEFERQLCSDSKITENLEILVKELIRSGQFAWALQQNRSVFVDSPKDLPGETVILHGMSTRTTTLGMFVGFHKGESSSEKTILSSLLSIMIDAAVFVIENDQLQKDLEEHNLLLEQTVEKRTHELREANQFLHQGNKELKRVNEKKSEFLGIAAHDLKNPLSGIIGLSQLISLSFQEAEDVDPELSRNALFVKEIEKSAEHMLAIINDLLNSESLNSGNLRLNKVPYDLGNIAKKVISVNNIHASEKSIQIEYEETKEIRVVVDSIRIHEAIDNLISNAIKYSSPGSSIKISITKHTDKKGNRWGRFSIKDEGPGLTESDKAHLFERFQKLSARPTAGESSTGLGLSIVKSIVELHDGHIWAESVYGNGSTFIFELPLI